MKKSNIILSIVISLILLIIIIDFSVAIKDAKIKEEKNKQVFNKVALAPFKTLKAEGNLIIKLHPGENSSLAFADEQPDYQVVQVVQNSDSLYLHYLGKERLELILESAMTKAIVLNNNAQVLTGDIAQDELVVNLKNSSVSFDSVQVQQFQIHICDTSSLYADKVACGTLSFNADTYSNANLNRVKIDTASINLANNSKLRVWGKMLNIESKSDKTSQVETLISR